MTTSRGGPPSSLSPGACRSTRSTSGGRWALGRCLLTCCTWRARGSCAATPLPLRCWHHRHPPRKWLVSPSFLPISADRVCARHCGASAQARQRRALRHQCGGPAGELLRLQKLPALQLPALLGLQPLRLLRRACWHCSCRTVCPAAGAERALHRLSPRRCASWAPPPTPRRSRASPSPAAPCGPSMHPTLATSC